MSNFDMKKGEPIYLQETVIEPIVEVQLVNTQNRFLGSLTTDPRANIGDTYWNTSTSRMKLFTKTGRQNT